MTAAKKQSTEVTTLEPQNGRSLVSRVAERFGVEPAKMLHALKVTAFRGAEISNEQMMALLVVADQYKLNPWTREIYAFPDKGAIVPVVGVDGWARIINEHDAFDGMSFEQDDESCTCTIYRKDRTHPISVTEYMSECRRDKSTAWQSHPKRMLRHKAMIQCSRIAFGFVGFYDPDEAERIIDVTPPKEQKRQTTLAELIEREPGLDDETAEFVEQYDATEAAEE